VKLVKKVTVVDFRRKKERGEKIVIVTAYDYPFAKIVDEAGVDAILVGDSLSMVVMGYDSTHRIGLREVIHHVKAVANARPRAMIIADMPFGSYEESPEKALRNAIRLIRAGADAVKIEGGAEVGDVVKKLVRAGIPVMGHIGLNPQRHLIVGGYKLMGKNANTALKILNDAKVLEEAGVFAIVVEHTVAEVAKLITESVSVPTICIGSGPWCDGQVLVLHDILGLSNQTPYFAKMYADLRRIALEAVKMFVDDVKSGRFPSQEHYKSFGSKYLDELRKALSKASSSDSQ